LVGAAHHASRRVPTIPHASTPQATANQTPMNILNESESRQAENLELLARQTVEGFIIGLHKSPFHGFSVEFAEHRLYNTGDSTKNIDWKVYARTDKLFLKRFEEETNLRCQIVIDASSSMFYPDTKATDDKKINKLKFSIQAAASLMLLLKKQRDAFGLTIFSNKIEQHTHARSSTSHYKLLLSYLAQFIELEKPLNRATNAAECLHEIADSIHRRSLVIIFSDMIDTSESEHLFSALQHLKHAKHEVVLFHVVDKSKEVAFEFENRPYMFVDMESGEKIRLQPNQVKEYYVEHMRNFTNDLKMKCLQYQIDFVEADINEGFRQILLPYLVKRSRMNA
jgi:uncharacterized protein (DUF58 family)